MSDASETPRPEAGKHDSSAPDPAPQGPPPTPFDHPLFLPALLFAGMIWFGYDGFINQDPDMLEHQTFNRVGFALLTLCTLWFGYKGLREWQHERAASEGSSDDGADRPPPLA